MRLFLFLTEYIDAFTNLFYANEHQKVPPPLMQTQSVPVGPRDRGEQAPAPGQAFRHRGTRGLIYLLVGSVAMDLARPDPVAA